MQKKVSVSSVKRYVGIIALIAIVMATGCTSLSQYFKGWTITIKPATDSSVSVDSTASSLSSMSTSSTDGNFVADGNFVTDGNYVAESTNTNFVGKSTYFSEGAH